MFPGAIAFSVSGTEGQPLFENFDGLVGPVCVDAMTEFADFADAMARPKRPAAFR